MQQASHVQHVQSFFELQHGEEQKEEEEKDLHSANQLDCTDVPGLSVPY